MEAYLKLQQFKLWRFEALFLLFSKIKKTTCLFAIFSDVLHDNIYLMTTQTSDIDPHFFSRLKNHFILMIFVVLENKVYKTATNL